MLKKNSARTVYLYLHLLQENTAVKKMALGKFLKGNQEKIVKKGGKSRKQRERGAAMKKGEY